MKLGTKTVCILGILILTISCSNSTPADFWNDFNSGEIQSENSDQGPWGGFKEVTWKTTESNKFEIENTIEFAEDNGWTLIDTFYISKNRTTPKLDLEDYSDDVLNSIINDGINWKDFTVFRFKTGWISVAPGIGLETNKNGILAINTEKRNCIFIIIGENKIKGIPLTRSIFNT